MYEHIRSYVWDPLDDPKHEEGAEIPSKHIKAATVCLLAIALAISIIIITVCGTTGPTDIKWNVTVTWVAIIWVTMSILGVGLYLTHPYYRGQLVGWISSRRCKIWKDGGGEVGDNPLIDPTDLEISLEE